MTIYISGKIGTLEITDAIRAKFNAVQDIVEREGHEAINPIDPKHNAGVNAYSVLTDQYTRHLLYDLSLVAKADAILLLPDYVTSPGAKAEYAFAQAIGKRCFILDDEVFIGILRQSGAHDPIDDYFFRYTVNELLKNSLRDIYDCANFDPWKFATELPSPPLPSPFRPIHHLP